MKNIVNIINFVRACEPRSEDDSFLLPTFTGEMELSRRYGFKTTVLLQYDALIRDDFVGAAKEYSEISEYGLWLEIVEPLAVDAGLVWKGRYPWDWHCDVGFTVGYEPDERIKLIETAFERFKAVFGYYPSVAGCWHIDAFSLEYISKKYGLKAFCICKEQYGTDGYTLWGGYYNGAYYPSKHNIICPGKTEKSGIDIPVFRMLGPDPIFQYDLGADAPERSQAVASLEPVYTEGGGSEKWVKWFLAETFNGKGLALSYAQTGQENSFGADSILPGLEMQLEILAGWAKAGKIEILSLGESGDWFRSNYRITPPASICCDSDHAGSGNKTAWYSCKNYRVNFHYRDDMLYIRDMYVFDERYRERFLEKRDDEHSCGYYNLPVIDGYRFSFDKLRAGIYPCIGGERIKARGNYRSSTAGEDTLIVSDGDFLTFTADENQVTAECSAPEWQLEFVFSPSAERRYVDHSDKVLFMRSDDDPDEAFDYHVTLSEGTFRKIDGKIFIVPANGKIVFDMC